MENKNSEVLPVENMNTDTAPLEDTEESLDKPAEDIEGKIDMPAEGAIEDTEESAEAAAEKKKSRKPRVKGETSSRKRKAEPVELVVDTEGECEPEFSTVDIDEGEAERLEAEAIAALPHAESLDSLMYDSYDYEDSHESAEERESYESFLAEYKRVISEALTYSKETEDTDLSELTGEEQGEHGDTVVDGDISEPDGSDSETARDVDTEEPLSVVESDGENSREPDKEEPEQLEMELELPEETVPESPSDVTIPPEDEEEPEYNPEKPRRIDSVFDFVELFVFTLLAVMIVTCFFFRNSIVDGSSMEGTLKDGEHLIITDVFYTPERGDIIVFEDFTIDKTEPLVKRVIAVGGDMIRVTGGKVYVNEELLTEDYVSSLEIRKEVPLMTVPEGEVFVMGDNRADSHDSRDFGTVSEDSILGKVILRFYPFDKFGKVE